MGNIHQFNFAGLNLVLDVESNCLHLVDDLAAAAITLLDQDHSRQACRDALLGRYPPAEVDSALGEVMALIEEGALFSKLLSTDVSTVPQRIKALCLHVAHACNLRCRYCFAGAGSFGGDQSLMPLEVGQAAIDFLLHFSAERRYCEIDFFGGEPLLNLAVVKELTAYGNRRAEEQQKKIQFTLTTNGTLMDEQTASFLHEHNFQVILSLDGRPEIHDALRVDSLGCGSYAQALAGARCFMQTANGRSHGYRPPYYIRGTFTKKNLDFSIDARHLADLGFRWISLEPVVSAPHEAYALREEDLPFVEEEYERLTKLYLKYYREGKAFNFFHFNIDLDHGPCLYKRLSSCGAGIEYLAVTPAGDLYPCHQFVGLDNFLMGNVLEPQSFSLLPQSVFPPAGPLEGECRFCWARYYCGGGCRAGAFFVNGDLRRPYALGCVLQKKRLECALYLQAKLALAGDDHLEATARGGVRLG